ncbi:hypothetical protein CNMCM5793_009477 [Aspergillus hiratsukae]|uniref:Uncharacterized protein n=1 Tax=Aspergillus hiratsukae TaxID=1194566 RepID=A0A8H6P987_9EURO|nr:hypothetical protein CNMCM5793_009477 [Aspergillus hiratsukae]KAF7160634.1 hypothetical protein CNMCM6106_008056 [Aspergillus hiratsukae]
MSFQLFDGAITVHTDTTPLALDEDTRTLYNRAITDPSSLTDAERRIITHRPPPEEEDALCQAACGQSMSELVAKAIHNGDALTYNEARLITAGVVRNQAGRLLTERARLSAADRDLTHRAAAAAMTEEMKAARTSAQAVQYRWNMVRIAAAEALSDDDIRNIRYAMRVPWQEHVLSFPEGTVCGLVLFYADVPEWPVFKAQIETAVFHGLHYKALLMNEAAIAKFTLHRVAVADTSVGALPSRFQTMRDNSEIPTGLRSDCFLYADEEALRSREEPRSYVWLCEPEETAEPLKVDIKHIAPTLFARLTQRDLAGEAKREPYRHTSELGLLHQAARHSRNAEAEPDGIWPPPSRYM